MHLYSLPPRSRGRTRVPASNDEEFGTSPPWTSGVPEAQSASIQALAA
jgi:hypothetical protein